MSLNILLLEDVHASATLILQPIRGAEILRLKHAPDARELESLLANVQVLGLRSRTALARDAALQACFGEPDGATPADIAGPATGPATARGVSVHRRSVMVPMPGPGRRRTPVKAAKADV